jgi:DNA/RNA endonuclease YhcR with UshA esterase domain
LQKFKTRDVEISGTVVDYRGKPEIILESTNQIKVVRKSD